MPNMVQMRDGQFRSCRRHYHIEWELERISHGVNIRERHLVDHGWKPILIYGAEMMNPWIAKPFLAVSTSTACTPLVCLCLSWSSCVPCLPLCRRSDVQKSTMWSTNSIQSVQHVSQHLEVHHVYLNAAPVSNSVWQHIFPSLPPISHASSSFLSSSLNANSSSLSISFAASSSPLPLAPSSSNRYFGAATERDRDRRELGDRRAVGGRPRAFLTGISSPDVLSVIDASSSSSSEGRVRLRLRPAEWLSFDFWSVGAWIALRDFLRLDTTNLPVDESGVAGVSVAGAGPLDLVGVTKGSVKDLGLVLGVVFASESFLVPLGLTPEVSFFRALKWSVIPRTVGTPRPSTFATKPSDFGV